MTVKELIEKLKEIPQDAVVWTFVDDYSAKANDIYCVSGKVYIGCEHLKSNNER